MAYAAIRLAGTDHLSPISSLFILIMETPAMHARYTPWWMPTALVALLLVSIALASLLVIERGGAGTNYAPAATNSGATSTEIFTWDLVTSWPKNFPGLGLAPENFAAIVQEMSNGRLVVNVHGANTIVPPLGVFDAVSSGSVEMGHSGAYYWKGKIPAAPFFTSVPFGMNSVEYNSWLHYGGGLELWREIYAPFGIIPFAGGNTGVQMGGWFNVEINSIEDIKGLKMRIPGLGGEVFTRSGGTAVNIPGAELYSALQTGVIDATEWVGPYNDLAIGFHQIAEYYYYPGWHEPGPGLEFIVNAQAFARLPLDLQKIVEVATRAINQDMLDEYQARSSSALLELRETYNVDIRPFPKEVMAHFRKNALSIYEEQAEADASFKKVSDHYFDYLARARGYSEISDKAYFDLR